MLKNVGLAYNPRLGSGELIGVTWSIKIQSRYIPDQIFNKIAMIVLYLKTTVKNYVRQPLSRHVV